MFDWSLYLSGLCTLLIIGCAGWLLSLARRNVTHVDSLWSLFFVAALASYLPAHEQMSDRSWLVSLLVLTWALRLSAYLTWRNWGPHEDRRYAAIRRNNSPYFWLKSLYIVFGLQALLAWIVSLPLLGIANSQQAMGWLDGAGLTLWLIGFVWESLADWQLASFQSDPANRGKVLDRGLWSLSRHPNYFGECCVWWAYFLFAAAAGAWWSLPGPLLMTWLLLRISGVALLERDIAERRPAYAQYVASTNAFLPGPKKG